MTIGVRGHVDNLIFFIIILKALGINKFSYNSNNMVWGSLLGTEIPDYEESTKLVFSL